MPFFIAKPPRKARNSDYNIVSTYDPDSPTSSRFSSFFTNRQQDVSPSTVIKRTKAKQQLLHLLAVTSALLVFLIGFTYSSDSSSLLQWSSHPTLPPTPEQLAEKLAAQLYADEPRQWDSEAHYPFLPIPHADYVDLKRNRHIALLEALKVSTPGPQGYNFWFGHHSLANSLQLSSLLDCLIQARNAGTGACALQPPKVVLTGYKYFTCSLIEDNPECSFAGETIWMRSVLHDLAQSDGIFYVTASPNRIMDVYQMLGDVVTHVWLEDGFAVACFLDHHTCLQSPSNPNGIPAWKIFIPTWWGHTHTPVVHTDYGAWVRVPEALPEYPFAHLAGTEESGVPTKINDADEVKRERRAKDMMLTEQMDHPEIDVNWSWNPLGAEWTLAPYEYPDSEYYLGYTILTCESVPVVDPEERLNEIFILGKKLEYYYSSNAYPLDFYATLAHELNVTLLSTAHKHEPTSLPLNMTLPEGVKGHEGVGRVEYAAMVGQSKVMLGIFSPPTSPSPYNALCQGVPVVLPYRSLPSSLTGWDLFNPDKVQHGPAALLGPPHVYSVDRDWPIEEVVQVIKEAMETPIGRYVPPEMTKDALHKRLDKYFSIDWEFLGQSRVHSLNEYTGLNQTMAQAIRVPAWQEYECTKEGGFCEKVGDYRKRSESDVFEGKLVDLSGF